MILWHIGNTTVRTPYRLRDALRVLQSSPFNGNISGKEQENRFAVLLHNAGILHAPRIADGRIADDLGRKWRSALSQLGFITPQLSRGIKSGKLDPSLALMTKEIKELSGRPYEITPNGSRLAQSEIITAQQECFLRSLTSYRIPSVIEARYDGERFSPLLFTLRVIHRLDESGQEGIIRFNEFALFVQTATPVDGIDSTVQKIVDFRVGRKKAKGNVRQYDRGFYDHVAKEIKREASTLNDYADLSFRYLKATSIFRASGRGIVLSPARRRLAALLCEEEAALDDKAYLHALWSGAQLPTDDAIFSRTVVCDLVEQLRMQGVHEQIPSDKTPPNDLENKRHELEAKILQLAEQEYANEQPKKLEEIMAWLEAISNNTSVKLPDGTSVSAPKGERPAYLEWAVWRAFLAVSSLCNMPWESRRFQIDQDFLPVHCAPSGGPDMVFEFEDIIVVVEVTLTASSRQEAAEGEPVRRHVAQYVEKETGKQVYGLFIAVQIDSNTANTFRYGDWYLPDDSKLSLDIVPIPLSGFKSFLSSSQSRLADMPGLLQQIMLQCRAKANQDAPEWKKSIDSIIQRVVAIET